MEKFHRSSSTHTAEIASVRCRRNRQIPLRRRLGEQSAKKLDLAVQQVMSLIDFNRGLECNITFDDPPEACDLCGCDLSERALFIDGRLQGQLVWSFMCPVCFLGNAVGIGWGEGQIYQLQLDGEWLMVAGFPQ
jgi:hypothetical protein